MIRQQAGKQKRLIYVDLDDYIPDNHILRLINSKVSFSFIYPLVAELYAQKGRPAVDPVRLVKMLLVGYLFGIPSERQLEQEVRMNLAYRWFLGLELDDPVPDHSTLSQNRRRRFRDSTVFQDVFDHVVNLCVTDGLVTGEVLVTDSTHIKACASDHKYEQVKVEKTPSAYMAQLDAEAERLEAELRTTSEERTGKKKAGVKPKPAPPPQPTEGEKRQSTTDPDSGALGRPGKPTGFHYLNHMTVDPQAGIITDVHVTAGNVNDHIPCPERLAVQKNKFHLDVKWLGADKGYDQLNVHFGLNELGIVPLVPRVKKQNGQESVGDFEYDPTRDVFVCPNGKLLTFSGVNRTDKTKMYHSRRSDCRSCPFAAACLPKHKQHKILKRPFHQHLSDQHHQHDGTPIFRSVQRLRRVWCEGTFALMKTSHNLRGTFKRGIANMREQCLLSALAVNLRRYVRWV